MTELFTIASDGSDRATAYHMSNKILRRPEGLYVTWLNDTYQGMLTRVNPRSGAIEESYAVHQGFDNHCGAALAMGPDGRMHFMGGSHSHAFVYRWSDNPADPQSWSLPQAVGACATYPSLVCTREGELLLTHRISPPSDRWGVNFVRMTADGWSWPYKFIQAPAPLYTFPTHSLALGTDGTLHLVVEFYKTFPNNASPAHSMAVAHLESPDNGVTWYHTDGRKVDSSPIGLEDTSPVKFKGGGDLRPGNIIVMPDNQPAFPIFDAKAGTYNLAVRRANRTWEFIDLTEAVAALRPGWKPSYQGQVAVDKTGNLLVATTMAPEPKWAHPESQVCALRVDPQSGNVLASLVIPKTRPNEPDWLPNLEKSTVGIPDNDLYLLYQSGNTGVGCVSGARTMVLLTKLAM